MNLSVENNLKKFFNKFYLFKQTGEALKYAPVVSEIKKRGLTSSKILEIGLGPLGITPYLKTQIGAPDIDFSGLKSNLPAKIKVRGEKFSFKANSYDVSVSVDSLENIPFMNREKAVFEMLRVTKKLAIIVVPCGEASEDQDKQLRNHWNKIFNKKNQYLEEHIKNGLPKVEEILVYIDKSKRLLGKNSQIKSYPNLNLFVRNILMRTWITKNKYSYYLYMKGYLLIVPILKYCNFGKTYRRVFVIEFRE